MLKRYIRQFLKVVFGLAVFGLIVLALEVLIRPPHTYRATYDDTQVVVKLNRQFVMLPDGWLTMTWDIKNAEAQFINAEPISPTGSMRIFVPDDYEITIISSDGHESNTTISGFVWLQDLTRLSTVGILAVIAISLGFYLGILTALWRWYEENICLAMDFLADQEPILESIQQNAHSLMILTVLNLVLNWILWLGFPLGFGPDADGYLLVYLQSFVTSEAPYYSALYIRPPLIGLLAGFTLEVGVWFSVLIYTLLATSAVLMVFLIVRPYGRFFAWFSALLFMVYIPAQLTWHRISSESLFMWATILFVFYLRYALSQPKLRYWIGVGVAIAIAAQVRVPGIGYTLIFGLVLFQDISLQKKIQYIVLGVVTTILLISPWVIFRGYKFGYWALSRANGTLLFTSTYYHTGFIKEENGPYSQELANLMQEHILNEESYQSKNLTFDAILGDSFSYKAHSYNDFVYVIDTYVGWDESHSFMNEVGMEAIKSAPSTYVIKVLRDIQAIMRLRIPAYYTNQPPNPNVEFNGEPFTPTRIYTFYDPYPEFVDPPSPEAINEVKALIDGLRKKLLEFEAQSQISTTIVQNWDKITPNPAIFYLFSLIGLALSRGISRWFLLGIFSMAILMIIPHAMLSPIDRYRIPTDIIFIIGATIGLKSVIMKSQVIFNRFSH